MARNGSGTYSVPNTFTPSTTISSSAVNSNFSDAGAELTNSLAADGQTTMTGAIKGANGSAATPSYGFASDANTGMYRKGADQLGFASAGTEAFYVDDDQTVVFVEIPLIGSNQVDSFPSGTVMLFNQTSAPTGWTKNTSTGNDTALRLTTGTVGTGGTVAFETAFASKTVSGTTDGHAITEAEMPSHRHFIANNGVAGPDTLAAGNQMTISNNDGGGNDYNLGGNGTEAFIGRTSPTGSGAAHTHTFTGNAINLDVAFVDVIRATKD